MKKHSTGALTKEQIAAQDTRYNEHSKEKEYDYVIIGTGNAALTAGSLLANAGHSVCMLEAHDIPGGYAHSFKMGDFHFCAQIHYIWGCYKGGEIYEFLKRIGLEKDIEFNLYDPEGYDIMALPDGKKVNVPMGYDKLAENIEAAYPGQGKNVEKFCNILTKLRKEMNTYSGITKWNFPIKMFGLLTLARYYKKTVQQVFDECNLSKEAQAVLTANAGDFMSPPDELSIVAYVYLFGGYNVGAYYPKKHYKYYIDRIAQFITDQKGCDIYYEMPVTNIAVENGKVTQVTCKDGKVFRAKNFICNADPQMVAEKLIGWDKFPQSFHKPLKYEYSSSGMVVYLGLKGIDLKKFGFGKNNIWHLQQWDMNKCWQEQLDGDFSKAWFFISTPTLHSKEPGTAPKGCEIMEIATLTDYDSFKAAQDKGYKDYVKKKRELADHLIDLVEKYYVPNLRKHIVTKVVGSTTTNEDFVMAPKGNAYGQVLKPVRVSPGKLTAKTPWNNFHWCNATSGAAGFFGTAKTGMFLYMKLTGDKFWNSNNIPSDKELLARIRSKKKK